MSRVGVSAILFGLLGLVLLTLARPWLRAAGGLLVGLTVLGLGLQLLGLA